MTYERRVGLSSGSSIGDERFENLKSKLRLAPDAIERSAIASSEYGAEMGAAEGMQTDEMGRTIAPELKSGFNIAQQSFNKAAIDSYKAGMDVDITNDLDRIYQENADDSYSYSEKIKAYRKGLEEELVPEAADEILFKFDKMQSTAAGKVAMADFEKRRTQAIGNHNQAIATYINQAQRSIFNNDDDAADEYIQEALSQIDRKLENGYITLEEAATEQQMVAKTVAQEKIKRTITEIYTEDGESQAFEAIDNIKRTVPEGYTVGEWNTFTSELVAQVTQTVTLQGKIRTEEEIATQTKISNLMVQAENPDADLAMIVGEFERMWNDPNTEITMAQHTSFLKNIASTQKSARKQQKSFSLIAKRLSGENTEFIPFAEENSYYDNFVQGASSQDKIMFVKNMKTGRIPTSLKNEINQLAVSGEPELLMRAVELVNGVDDVDGISYDFISPNQRSFIKQAVTLSNVYEDPTKAIAQAREITDPKNQFAIDKKKDEIKENKYMSKVRTAVEDDYKLDGWLSYDIQETQLDRLEQEVGTIAESLFFTGYGDWNDSMDEALKLAKKDWGSFRFGGRNDFMKYPMGTYYADSAGSTQYITDQAAEQISELEGSPIEAENIYFLDDDRTKEEARTTGEPTYLIYYLDDMGTPSGIGYRFKPDLNLRNDLLALERVNRAIEEGEGSLEEQAARKRSKAITREEAKKIQERVTQREAPKAL